MINDAKLFPKYDSFFCKRPNFESVSVLSHAWLIPDNKYVREFYPILRGKGGIRKAAYVLLPCALYSTPVGKECASLTFPTRAGKRKNKNRLCSKTCGANKSIGNCVPSLDRLNPTPREI